MFGYQDLICSYLEHLSSVNHDDPTQFANDYNYPELFQPYICPNVDSGEYGATLTNTEPYRPPPIQSFLKRDEIQSELGASIPTRSAHRLTHYPYSTDDFQNADDVHGYEGVDYAQESTGWIPNQRMNSCDYKSVSSYEDSSTSSLENNFSDYGYDDVWQYADLDSPPVASENGQVYAVPQNMDYQYFYDIPEGYHNGFVPYSTSQYRNPGVFDTRPLPVYTEADLGQNFPVKIEETPEFCDENGNNDYYPQAAEFFDDNYENQAEFRSATPVKLRDDNVNNDYCPQTESVTPVITPVQIRKSPRGHHGSVESRKSQMETIEEVARGAISPCRNSLYTSNVSVLAKMDTINNGPSLNSNFPFCSAVMKNYRSRLKQLGNDGILISRCNLCSSFSTAHTSRGITEFMKLHLFSHAKKNPFCCRICGKSETTNPSKVRAHINKYHPNHGGCVTEQVVDRRKELDHKLCRLAEECYAD